MNLPFIQRAVIFKGFQVVRYAFYR